jgi:hypothetical protein
MYRGGKLTYFNLVMDCQQIVYLHLRLCKGGNFVHMIACVSNDDPSCVIQELCPIMAEKRHFF